MTQRRLIEETFPLKKVSEDSKHERNVRHGQFSTLHIWPARRPLTAWLCGDHRRVLTRMEVHSRG